MTFTELLAESRRLVGANSQSYSTSDITSSANRALERATALIREAQGRWQWDDSNYTDLPFSTTGLVTDQQDYELDSTHYRIQRFEVKDTAGNWTKLMPIDQADVFDQSITDYLSSSGIPQYYDKVGNSILLYPKPSYTQASSLKAFYERGPSYFETSDTTKTPGFNPLFHRLISLWSAYDYAFINQLKVAGDLRGEINVMEDQLKEHYSQRDRDDRHKLAARPHNFR